jgi:hypothetical protein
MGGGDEVSRSQSWTEREGYNALPRISPSGMLRSEIRLYKWPKISKVATDAPAPAALDLLNFSRDQSSKAHSNDDTSFIDVEHNFLSFFGSFGTRFFWGWGSGSCSDALRLPFFMLFTNIHPLA